MASAVPFSPGEKMRLYEHMQAQHLESQPSYVRTPASGSNTVPMTEEELESSPAHNQFSPVPSQHSAAYAPALGQQPSAAALVYANPRSPTPPPYSGPSSPAQEPSPAAHDPQEGGGGGPKPPPRYPGLPALDYRLYKPALFELSADKTAIKSTAAHLSSSAEALAALVRQQAAVPPKPQIHIVGRRGTSPTSGRVDFHVKLNLLPLLVPDDPRQRMDYLRCVGPGELAFRGSTKPTTQPDVEGGGGGGGGGGSGGGGGGGGGLEAWAARFVADSASIKTFVLERVVINLDADWLEGQIRKLVVAMRYPGAVAVTFPTTHSRVVVQNPDRHNKFLTSVAGFFSGKKRYEVVRAVWPFATVPRGSEGERRCAVQSEETWWREWRGPIRYAIASKRFGWVTNEDKLEALMEGTPSTTPADVDWGPNGTY